MIGTARELTDPQVAAVLLCFAVAVCGVAFKVITMANAIDAETMNRRMDRIMGMDHGQAHLPKA